MDFSKTVEQLDAQYKQQYENAKPKKLTPLERQPRISGSAGGAVASSDQQQKTSKAVAVALVENDKK